MTRRATWMLVACTVVLAADLAMYSTLDRQDDLLAQPQEWLRPLGALCLIAAWLWSRTFGPVVICDDPRD